MGNGFIAQQLTKYKEELLRQKEELKSDLLTSTYKATVLLVDDANAVITSEVNTIRMKMMQIDKIEEKLKRLETIDSEMIERKIKEKAINTDKLAALLD